MSEAEYVDGVVVEKIRELADGGPCCVDVLERELGFDPGESIARLLNTARIAQAPGCCSHCSSILYRVAA